MLRIFQNCGEIHMLLNIIFWNLLNSSTCKNKNVNLHWTISECFTLSRVILQENFQERWTYKSRKSSTKHRVRKKLRVYIDVVWVPLYKANVCPVELSNPLFPWSSMPLLQSRRGSTKRELNRKPHTCICGSTQLPCAETGRPHSTWSSRNEVVLNENFPRNKLSNKYDPPKFHGISTNQRGLEKYCIV